MPSASANLCLDSAGDRGHFKFLLNNSTCQTPGVRGKELYELVIRITDEMSPGVYCAKVAEVEAGSGNYTDSSCTKEVESGKGEYVIVNGINEWLVSNSEKDDSAEQLPAALGGELEGKDGTLLFHLLNLSLGLLCTSSTFTEIKLKAGAKLAEGGTVSFSGCIVKDEKTKTTLPCTVNSIGAAGGTITSKKLKGQLQSNGEMLIESTTVVEEKGKNVGVLAELEFKGAECMLIAGKTSIKGALWLKDSESKIKTRLVKHLFEESTAHGHTMWVGEDTAEHLETNLDGGALVALTGAHAGLTWSAMFE